MDKGKGLQEEKKRKGAYSEMREAIKEGSEDLHFANNNVGVDKEDTRQILFAEKPILEMIMEEDYHTQNEILAYLKRSIIDSREKRIAHLEEELALIKESLKNLQLF